MQSANRFAFKEWAVVCAALARGRQSLIVRKGGIHEGRDGFRVEHREFWLFPTRFHQQPDEIVPDARPLLDQVAADQPPVGTIRISHYAAVAEVIRIEDESLLPRLTGLHVLSGETVHDRFHYRQPGLFVLPVRVYRREHAIELPDAKHFAGCRSWVDFPEAFPTAGLEPVLADAAFDAELERIRASVGSQ